MKLGVLFSGGKDSTFAAYLAQKEGHELVCLMSVFSANKYSYMFHTPSISKVVKQASVMSLPLITKETEGKKEEELEDLEEIIKEAKGKFEIEGVVTGAVASKYQASRIENICSSLGLRCVNPLWGKGEFQLLEDLIDESFEVIIIGVAADPLDEKWLGREIDSKFVSDVKKLYEKYKIHPAGEGGEFETFVLNCPLFKKGLKVVGSKVISSGSNHQLEIEVG